ncbi:MAG: hypothetical protein O6922_00075 [Chloroflexi bacterium]|nr:hypothetical protein [Chloroflexota bacterium]
MNRVKCPLGRSLFSLVVFVVAVTVTGCGSSSGGAGNTASFAKISDTGRILSIEDVEGLTGAVAAYIGFWTPPGLESLNYEIRVYPSHQAAVEKGTSFAEEASGESAVLNADEATWPVGVRDRRMIVGGGSRGSQNPRYGDYVILSNLVILCEGRTSEHSIERCVPFVTLLRGEGA